MTLTLVSSNKSFGGCQQIFSHYSKELQCDMKFSIYLPPASEFSKVPVLYWLSGLTCNEENFIQKAGAQKYAAEHEICIVCADTSPRNVSIAGQDDSYDFGSGAGFYINATLEPWKKHYRMFSYVTTELIQLINENFRVLSGVQSISGHSMGGHGALICALKNPGQYLSVSAFAPIANPINCPWGQKAFKGYLGEENKEDWKEWDATELVSKYNGVPIELFIDQGSEDNFLKQKQLLPENLIRACASNQVPCILNTREGYDHSYYYIATFIGEHIAYHAKHLKR